MSFKCVKVTKVYACSDCPYFRYGGALSVDNKCGISRNDILDNSIIDKSCPINRFAWTVQDDGTETWAIRNKEEER